MSAQQPVAPAEKNTRRQRRAAAARTTTANGRSEQELIAATAGQQRVRTGLLPAPGFLKRFAKAR
jgi:hypothetical protein